jgi:hypothetical protein
MVDRITFEALFCRKSSWHDGNTAKTAERRTCVAAVLITEKIKRMKKIVMILLGGVALLSVFMKLFTYEFFFKDDPTGGLAVRSTPSLINHQIVTETSSDWILLMDENGFLGEEIYHAIVHWGWIVFTVIWLLLLGISFLHNSKWMGCKTSGSD